MKKVCFVDSYDSFSQSIVALVESCGVAVEILHNSNTQLLKDISKEYSHMIIGPGPDLPKNSGFLLDTIEVNVGRLPILGICLGHQAIAEFYGASLIPLPKPMHGKISSINIDTNSNSLICKGISSPVLVGRYNSWTVDFLGCNTKELKLYSADDGSIMILEHKKDTAYGVQFHPESMMTENGKDMMLNFLHLQTHEK